MIFSAALQRYRLQFAGVVSLLAVLYSRIIPGMVSDWSRDENYSHGFIVPFITAYLLWQRWPELKGKSIAPSSPGLLVIVWGVVQLLVAWLGTEYFSMRSSLIVILAGMTLFFFGREVLKVVALPLGYLLFMVPIPYIIYDAVAFPLKLFVSSVSVAVLKIMNVAVLREGNIIVFPSTALEVTDACSGIRSLMSLLAIAVAYSFVTKMPDKRRWIMIALAIPIAVATNALRVIITGILSQWWGSKAAEGFFHECAGMAVFGLAIVILSSIGEILRCTGRESRD